MEKKTIGWVARDKSGLLIIGTQKPIKENKLGIWVGFAEHMRE
jgi:hypothetical protein